MRTIRTSFATAVHSPFRCTPIAKRSNASSAISLSCCTAMITAACANRLRICARGSIRIDCALSGKLQRQAIDEAELRPVITGFNTDIRHNDKVYHIQTEDKGLQNPYIESLVYVGGEILASKKTSYAEQIKGGGSDEKWIGGLMEQQHRTMIAAIKRGRFDAPADATAAAASTTGQIPKPTISAPLPEGAAAVSEERTLDQVIIDYLASEAESEHLELSLMNQVDFVAGAPIELRVATKKS